MTRAAAKGSGFTGRKWVRWTERRKRDFLDELAASCRVAVAAEAVGVPAVAAYYLRRRDEEFAAGWQVALRQGYEMLELALVGHALGGGGPTLAEDDAARRPVDVELALRLLKDVRDRMNGRRQSAGGPTPLVATRAQTNAAIIKKLAAIEGRLGLTWPPEASPKSNEGPSAESAPDSTDQTGAA